MNKKSLWWRRLVAAITPRRSLKIIDGDTTEVVDRALSDLLGL